MTTASASITRETARSLISMSSKNRTGSSAKASRKTGVNSGKCLQVAAHDWRRSLARQANGRRTLRPCRAPRMSFSMRAQLLLHDRRLVKLVGFCS